MTYDDERVIALLRESVPAVPEVPSRVASVRRIASRQRTAAALRVVTSAASLLLVAAALVRVSHVGEVEPVGDPFPRMMEHFGSGTVRIERRADPVAGRQSPPTLWELRLDRSQLRVVRDHGATESRVFGGHTATVMDDVLFTRDTASTPLWVRHTAYRWRETTVVDRLAEDAPGWVDVAYVGQGRVRGVRVAEYTARPPRDSPGHLWVTFRIAVDSEGRLRLFAETLGDGHTTTYEFFDWGKPLTIEAPHEGEFIDRSW